MKRKLKNKFNRILSGGGVLLSLCNVSLLGVGFSSWVAGEQSNPKIDINASVGDIKEPNLRDSVVYVSNSESGFNYYIYDNQYYFTDTSYSILLKINPSSLKNYANEYSDISFVFTLEYSIISGVEFDIFSSINSYTIPPESCIYSLDLNNEFYMKSNPCTYSKNTTGNITSYKLTSSICLFGNNSLYSFTKNFQKSNEYITIEAKYEFTLQDSFLNHIDVFDSISMNFILSTKGVAS